VIATFGRVQNAFGAQPGDFGLQNRFLGIDEWIRIADPAIACTQQSPAVAQAVERRLQIAIVLDKPHRRQRRNLLRIRWHCTSATA
jgi:hypothetical protein